MARQPVNSRSVTFESGETHISMAMCHGYEVNRQQDGHWPSGHSLNPHNYNPDIMLENGWIRQPHHAQISSTMLPRLFLLFVCVPLIDLIILLRIGRILGFWQTLGVVILTGAVGAFLARSQGIKTLSRIQAELSAGRMPTDELADGALILLASALLLTPGFLTDVVAVAFLIPICRKFVRQYLIRFFKSRVTITHLNVPGNVSGAPDDQEPFHPQPQIPGRMKFVKNQSPDGQRAN